MVRKLIVLVAALAISFGPFGLAQPATFPLPNGSYTIINNDGNDCGGSGDDYRDVVTALAAYDSTYLYLRMDMVSDAGWGPDPGDNGRYKWAFDTNGNGSISGGNILGFEYLLMLEDLDPGASNTGDGLGDLRLFNSTPTQVGATITGTGSTAQGGTQSAGNADIGYRISGDIVDMYISFAALGIGGPSGLTLLWATDQENPNLDQAPNCDRPNSDNFLQIPLPDLVASKDGNVSSITVGNPFQWTVTVSNTGDAVATFSSGQVILEDALPGGPIYGAPSIVNVTNVAGSGNISCSINGTPELTCTAIGNVSIGATTGTFGVRFNVTPQGTGSLTNPSGGTCEVDPDAHVTEGDETNNDCGPDTVTVNILQYTLTVLGSGAGEGTMTGTGITCASAAGVEIGDCSETANSGTAFAVTAAPAGGSSFGGWTGCDSTSPPVVDGFNSMCNVTLNANRTITALFLLVGSDLESCIQALDEELEALLEELKQKDVPGARAAVEGVRAQGAICNDLIDDLREETLPVLDDEGPANVNDDLSDERIAGAVLDAIIQKLEAELQAKKSWLSLMEGVKDGILVGVRAISNGPTAGNCTAANLGKTACDDMLDFVQTLGAQHPQTFVLWTQMQEAVRRMIDIKVRTESIVFRGVIKDGHRRCNPDLGAAQCFDFIDLDDVGVPNPTYQGLINEMEAEIDCLDNPSTAGCQPWYLTPLALPLSVSGLAAAPLSVTKVFAAPNPASLAQGQVQFVAQGSGIAQVQVEVYDLAGGLVFSSGFQSGHALGWNLLNQKGRPVANGVYLYVLTAQGYRGDVLRSQIHKLVVLK